MSSGRPAAWRSCQIIAPNLKATYRLLEDRFEIEYFQVDFDSNWEHPSPEAYRKGFVSALERFLPDELILVDDLPDLLKIFAPIPDGPAIPIPEATALTFHVYGNFTLRSREWTRLAALLLSRCRVKFLCASPRQTKLVGGFLGAGDTNAVRYSPFAVDCEEWRFEEGERTRTRAALEIRENQRLILYSGRISLQKNVIRLIREFAELVRQGDQSSLLGLIGPFDDRDGISLKLNTPFGYMFHKIQLALRELSDNTRSRIRFFEPRIGDELRELYCAADVFASLSLYHDEDFGMAPGEALATGLPAILSDWGGYPGFARPEVPCETVPVTLETEGLSLRSADIQAALRNALDQDVATSRRRVHASAFKRYFSIPAIAETMKEQLDAEATRFPGFNSRLKYLSTLAGAAKPHPEWIPGSKTFYEEIYRSYFQKGMS
ncbi:MAG: glycosyltransferase family 4 protein [Oligoflexia bacterium]|nr:glycosyltransferase family 4 protein [Oligoflexia bacterium]